MTQATVQIIGSPLSPYVRKVLAASAFKGIEVALDPLVPFFGDERFSELSPLRNIPVLRDERVSLCDSSVICQYLEDRWPSPRLYPEDIGQRARARWLEEFADTRMGDVFIWRLYNNAVIAPSVFGSARDAEVRRQAYEEELPAILDYLEAEMPEDGFLCGELSIADIAVAPFFDNLVWCRAAPDWKRWPRAERWLERTAEGSVLGHFSTIGTVLIRTPIPEHRDKLAELGVALTPDTLASATPRRGPMTV